MSGLNVDGFLNHKTSSGGSTVLNWREDGAAVIWLHQKSQIYPVYGHTWYERVEVEDRENNGQKKNLVFRRRFNCHERELINRKQNFRDKSTGEREYPPELCPMDFFLEKVHAAILDKQLGWTEPLFSFESDDPDKCVTLTSGGLIGAFRMKPDKMPDELKQAIRKARIKVSESWVEDVRSKLNYVFVVIGDPSEGVVIAIEGKAIGDKMKGAIRDKIRAKGREKGDPTIAPYPFEWQFDDSKEFDDKYHVVALEDPPSPEVLKLFKEPPPRDLEKFTDPGNCLWLFESMRAHFIGDEKLGKLLDIEGCFKKAKEAGLLKEEKKSSIDDGDDGDDGDDDDSDFDPAKIEKELESSAELYDCDACGAEKVMAADAFECPKCKAAYDEDGRLVSRPCVECGTAVSVTEEERVICGKCATIHETKSWKVLQKGGGEEKPVRRTRAEAAKEKVASSSSGSGDRVPWKG